MEKQKTPLCLAIERLIELQNLYDKDTPQNNCFGIAINELESLKPTEIQMFEDILNLGNDYDLSTNQLFEEYLTQD